MQAHLPDPKEAPQGQLLELLEQHELPFPLCKFCEAFADLVAIVRDTIHRQRVEVIRIDLGKRLDSKSVWIVL